MLLQGALVATAIGVRDQEYAGTLLGAAQMAAGLISQRYGRNAEREADFYGTEYLAAAGYDPLAAVTLQETFVRLSESRETNWLEGLFASHPPSTERVANNKSILGRLRETYPAATRFGADEYQRAMRQITTDKPAYAAYDKARKAVAEKQWPAALADVNEALALQPKEAIFHDLRGNIRYRQKRYQDALTNYNRAVSLSDDYFSPLLGRGMTRKALKDSAGARADLSRSLELLPTSVAYNALGEIAEANGNKDDAVRYYQAAAEAKGEVGRTALVNSLRLDMPANPGRYVVVRIARDNQQRLVLQVANTTPVPVSQVQVAVELLANDGSRKTYRTQVEQLNGNATHLVQVPVDSSKLVDARAQVVAARLGR